MLLADHTAATPDENLALDEALLLAAEGGGDEVLRFWELPQYAVVLGAGGVLADDVDEAACTRPAACRCTAVVAAAAPTSSS